MRPFSTAMPVTSSILVAACPVRTVRHGLRILAIVSLLLVAFAATAAGQLNPYAPLVTALSWTSQDVAYDPAHDAYLYVSQFPPSASPAMGGLFINGTTHVASAPFVIGAITSTALSFRAVYSPDVSDGVGGLGAFVVMWSEGGCCVNGTLQAQIVAYPGRLVGPRTGIVSPAVQVRNLSGSYSSTSRVFLFAWGDSGTKTPKFERLDLSAQPFGIVTPLSVPRADACDVNAISNCVPVVSAWNSVTDEFGIAFLDGPQAQLTFARVAPSGAILGRTVLSVGSVAAALAVNPITGSYIVAWDAGSGPSSPSMARAELDSTGIVLNTGTISGISSSAWPALEFSPFSQTFLLATTGWLVELDGHGRALADPVRTFDNSVRGIAAKLTAAEWIVGWNSFGKIVTTNTGETPCATPDPFFFFGGGSCINGGWYPPVAGTTRPPFPPPMPPSPPPPTPGSCVTPDPFTAFGGGTCFNGGWYPPGAGGPAPPTPPAPPPPVPGGCATPDPFVAFGGGVCFNGGWYFRS
jgi:hypothetical protein